MKKIKKVFRFPFFGILIGFLPLLMLWSRNVSQMRTRDAWFSLLVTLGFTVIFSTLFLLIYRNKFNANLALTVFFLLFFSYGHVYNAIKGKSLFGQEIGFIKLLVFYALILIVTLAVIPRIKKVSRSTTMILNGLTILLCLFNIGSILIYNLQARTIKTDAPELSASSEANVATADEDQPDVYYLVLDAYSRQDVLKNLMNYDNSDFINGLRQRGFYVVDCAHSNYDGTVASMASSLNYEYLNEEDLTGNNLPLVDMLINNKIRSDLKAFGYQFVTTRGFSSENDIPNSDIYLEYLSDAKAQQKIAQDQFTRLYYETTLLRAVFELYDQNPVRYSFLPTWLVNLDTEDEVLAYASYWYHQTNYVFDSLQEFPTKSGNYFVYAHINLPHGPYVFDADGNFDYVYNPEDNVPYYNEAVTYANKRTLELIDTLIEKSSIPPIIFLQSDHAAHVITSALDKTKILNAYYVPSKMKESLYQTITPVNSFRLLLRDQFGQAIELLPDQVYAKELNTYQYYPAACDLTP